MVNNGEIEFTESLIIQRLSIDDSFYILYDSSVLIQTNSGQISTNNYKQLRNLKCRTSRELTCERISFSSPTILCLLILQHPLLSTISMIKPDGVQRGLIGEIISRFEKKVNSCTTFCLNPRLPPLTVPLCLPITGIQASGTEALLTFSRAP